MNIMTSFTSKIINKASTNASNFLIESLKNAIVTGLVYSVDISSFGICSIKKFIFKNSNISSNSSFHCRKQLSYYDDMNKEFLPGSFMTPFHAFYIYKETPIYLEYKRAEDEDDDKNTSIEWQLYIYTIKTKKHINTLEEFISKLDKYISAEIEGEETGKYVYYDNFMRNKTIDHKGRNFSNVFVPNKQEDLILNSVNSFMHSREWYMQHHIPYHFGILLYGPPASGKTSIAQAIVEQFKIRNTVVVTGDSLYRIASIVDESAPFYYSKNKSRAVIVEDIDCSKISSMRGSEPDTYKNKEDYQRSGLGTLLNSIDGIYAPSNIIYIFTTNHPEQIDPALIRPGRIDLALKIDYANEETFRKFCEFHYGEGTITPLNIKPETTFAELQTLVMKGYSLEQLIEYVKE